MITITNLFMCRTYHIYWTECTLTALKQVRFWSDNYTHPAAA